MPYERTIIKRGQALNVPDVRSDFCGGKSYIKLRMGRCYYRCLTAS